MKKAFCILFVAFSVSVAFGQCPYDNTNYGNITPDPCTGVAGVGCAWAGDSYTVDVVAGTTYTFSTCGLTAFDTQLTLYTFGGATVLSYDDDGCGLQSEIVWTATFTGTVEILVDEYFLFGCEHFTYCMGLEVSYPVPPPPSDCTYSLVMHDAAGDGWDGSVVEVQVYDPIAMTTCTYAYTMNGTWGEVDIPAQIGDQITITYYTGGGLFENEISYFFGMGDGTLFGDGPNPSTASPAYFGIADCVEPAPSPQDCAGSVQICSDQTFNANSNGPGMTLDMGLGNQGCLLADEQQGSWYFFSPFTSGTIGLNISPQNAADDYDFALWGPMNTVTCPPPGAPTRCSYSDDPGDTGMNSVAADLSEPFTGDKWVSDIDVVAGQIYMLYIDNFSASGQPFDLDWDLTAGATLDCTVLPVELLSFTVDSREVENKLEWSTATELHSAYFELQHSIDGSEFQNIAELQAAGNSSTQLNYTHLDQNPVNGVNYYRLKQFDQDGTFAYSSIVVATNRFDEFNVQDPVQTANGTLDVEVHAANPGALSFELYDLTGRRILLQNANYDMGVDHLNIRIDRIAIGTYVYRVMDKGGKMLKSDRLFLAAPEH